MRLNADQVKQAILHEDRDVREAAVYYFARSFGTDPNIMPLAIQAIEQYGWKDAFETVPGCPLIDPPKPSCSSDDWDMPTPDRKGSVDGERIHS